MDPVKNNGVVFTPEYISDYMCSFIQSKNDLTILEPSCGEGIFIKSLLKTKLKYKLHANDINSIFLDYCKSNYTNCTFTNDNFIKYDKSYKYDCIIMNPPYTRIQNLQKDEINSMKKEYPILTGNFDIYLYFLVKCFDMLYNDGQLICIIPNSFLYNKSCSKVKAFLEPFIEYIIDFKDTKIFKGFSVYTCIIVINKDKSNLTYRYKTVQNIDNLLYNNYQLKTIDNTIQSSILGEYKLKNGIATLADDIFIIKEIDKEDDNYLYFTKNKMNYKIEKGIMEKILKVSKNMEYYIIYPYTSDGKIKANLNEYPYCLKYLETFKEKLRNRDRGNKQYEAWYAYGRKQAILKNTGVKMYISPLVQDISTSLITSTVPLFYSGLQFQTNDIESLKKLLIKNEAKILEHSNMKSGGWYSINGDSFRF